MAAPRVKGATRVVLLLIVALVVWFTDQRRGASSGRTAGSGKPPAEQGERPSPPSPSPGSGGKTTSGRYETFTGCQLEDHRQNDGDSFLVKLPGGRTETFRLYYVDCPESAFRSYSGGATNHERIRQQADYFGITPEQAVEVGQLAKKHTLGLLARGPFTLSTAWEDPFGDHRYHAFIEVDGVRLEEDLVREGLVRIFTKPAELPDGTPAKVQLRKLHELEDASRAARRGAWKFSRP